LAFSLAVLTQALRLGINYSVNIIPLALLLVISLLDPDALFKVAVTAAGTANIATVARTAVGNNSVLIQTAGSTATGDSKISISSTTATTNTQPIRIIDVVPETATGADAFVEVIVKWNWGMHQYQNATGV
jgi:hypothetical protein